jgi:predicted transcriptional regulator
MARNTGSVLTKSFRKEVELLSRHVQLLNEVKRSGPIGIVRLSALTNMPQHKVRYSLRILQESDYIEPTTRGAAATEKTDQFLDHVTEILDEAMTELQQLRDQVKRSDGNERPAVARS